MQGFGAAQAAPCHLPQIRGDACLRCRRMSRRRRTTLCSEPGCGEVIVDGPGRCPKHRRRGWDTWKAANPEKSDGYDRRWTRLRDRLLAERGALCEFCGAVNVPLQLHHLDHQPPDSPRGLDPANLKFACGSCHRREGQRRTTTRRR